MADDSAVVLMYHRFGEDRYPSTSIKIDQFEAQLELLQSEGFAVVPLADLLAALTGGKALPPNAVVITIDDAYRSIYEVAYPLFRQYGFPFTVFVATDPIDHNLPANLSWDQMQEMAGHGASYANHTASHLSLIKRLTNESDDNRIKRVMSDVAKGYKRLAEELDPLPNAFAYPYGEYDGEVASQLRQLGYICFGQQSGAVGLSSDLRALPRFPINETYAAIGDFRVKVKCLPMPVSSLTPWESKTENSLPEIEVTLAEPLDRPGELACYVSGQGRTPVRWIAEGKRFAIGPQKPFGKGRQRVNCTVPRNDGRYLWFSHPWFVRISGP
jgi:peptidoglycan/xylan/chitin deacetylase (PgdA/CDA1 family)